MTKKAPVVLMFVLFAVCALAEEIYFPEASEDWKRRKPEEAITEFHRANNETNKG